MKTWTSDNPKASLMKRKRGAIVDAARQAFLDNGFAQTSMDCIAATASVSIKTVYRHFENKDDLFSAVMQAACSPDGFDELKGKKQDPAPLLERPWFSKPPRTALVMAGIEYLQHTLSKEQLALYRVVTQDAHRFPELGRRYREEVVERRNALFSHYLDRWTAVEKWKVKDSRHAANTFVGLLRANLFEEALHGLHNFDPSETSAHARLAAANMLILLKAGQL
jgi:TetR/AcrR family transcriptional repressor of mexJK operon